MPIEIEYEPNEICVLRIRGVLKQSEFAAKQKALADKIDVGAKPRVSLLSKTSRVLNAAQIGTIWISSSRIPVRSPKLRSWRSSDGKLQALAFAGAGVRRAPVKFFPPDELAAARTWLTQ